MGDYQAERRIDRGEHDPEGPLKPERVQKQPAPAEEPPKPERLQRKGRSGARDYEEPPAAPDRSSDSPPS